MRSAAEFVKGMVMQLIEKSTGAGDAMTFVNEITTGCPGMDALMAPFENLYKEGATVAAQPDWTKSKQYFAKCADLAIKGMAFNSYLVAASAEDQTIGLTTSVTDILGVPMNMVSYTDGSQFSISLRFMEISLKKGWFEVYCNGQKDSYRLGGLKSDAVTFGAQAHAALFGDTPAQNWLCEDVKENEMAFKNEKQNKYMTVAGGKLTFGAKTSMKVIKIPDVTDNLANAVLAFINKFNAWYKSVEAPIKCLLQKMEKVKDNLISVTIVNVAAIIATKAVAHGVLAVFTLGIGNAILAAASMTITAIQGCMDVVKLMSEFKEAIASKDLAKALSLGKLLVKFIVTTYKFLASIATGRKKN